MDFDVVIIGAGAAGLAAAVELTRAGLRTTLLEARDQPGGRVMTHLDSASGQAIELGAEFIHGKPPEIWDLLATHPVPVHEGLGDDFTAESGTLRPCDSFFEEVEKLLARMPECSEPDRSFCDFLRACAEDASEETRRHALRYVTGFNAADATRISVQSLVHQSEAEEEIEGDRIFRPEGGYQRLVQSMLLDANRRMLTLESSTIVRRIRWERGHAIVDTVRRGAPGIHTAPLVLITVPLAVLQSEPGADGAIAFVPPFEQKRFALSHLAMGAVLRVTLTFSERFWANLTDDNSRSLANLRFLFTDSETFPTWWTLAPDTAPLIVGWSPAQSAQRLSGLPETAIVQEAVRALAQSLKVGAHTVESSLHRAYVHDWQSDPFSRGAYSYVCAGGVEAPRLLAEPVEQTLFFAGEATDTTGHIGTVHGAIASGLRAAKEIAERFYHLRNPERQFGT